MDLLAIGKLLSPFGVKGYIRVNTYSGETGHFSRLETVTLELDGKTKSAVVEDVKETGSGPLVKFKGFDAPETARTLLGYEIKVPREHAAPLDKDEYYITDLVGMNLVSGGEVLARIVGVLDGAACQYLEAKLPNGETRLVPFMNEYVGAVNLNDKTIMLEKVWILE